VGDTLANLAAAADIGFPILFRFSELEK